MSSRLAAIVPVAGSFQIGFNEHPSISVSVMDVHGNIDNVVPANVSLSGDGWYYTVVSEIMNGNKYNLGGWKAANECVGESSHYSTVLDGECSLYCVSEGTCSGGDVVRC